MRFLVKKMDAALKICDKTQSSRDETEKVLVDDPVNEALFIYENQGVNHSSTVLPSKLVASQEVASSKRARLICFAYAGGNASVFQT